jgi:hypothetical protein
MCPAHHWPVVFHHLFAPKPKPRAQTSKAIKNSLKKVLKLFLNISFVSLKHNKSLKMIEKTSSHLYLFYRVPCCVSEGLGAVAVPTAISVFES